MYLSTFVISWLVKTDTGIRMHAYPPSPWLSLQHEPRTHQCPEDREHAGSAEDEEAAERLGVVGLHHLYDAQQGLDAGSP